VGRSNQSIWCRQRVFVREGVWVHKGDLLADGRASLRGRLAVGHNLLLGYLPWDGLNFEDALVASERLKTKEIFTSIHVETWERKLQKTPLGIETFTPFSLSLVYRIQGNQYGSCTGSFLVRKMACEQNFFSVIAEHNSRSVTITFLKLIVLLRDVKTERLKKKIGMFFVKAFTVQHLKYLMRNYIDLLGYNDFSIEQEKWKLLFPGYKALDHCGFVQVGAWVKPNQILFLRLRPLLPRVLVPYERLLFDVLAQDPPTIRNVSVRVPLGVNGRVLNVVALSSEAKTKSRFASVLNLRESFPERTFCSPGKGDTVSSVFDFWPIRLRGDVHEERMTFSTPHVDREHLNNSFRQASRSRVNSSFGAFSNREKAEKLLLPPFIRVLVSIAIHRKIQIGDKMAGRHGNKGILTCLVPTSSIPYLANGLSMDLVLNPLGIPSRINVGQIYESVLGLAGIFTGECYLIPSFDERTQAKIASRSIAFEKLCEVRVRIRQWCLFDPICLGKVLAQDGRTGESIGKGIALGESYILKLVHIVDEKVHARSTGPYSLVTQQPVRGRTRKGGQRVGEIEMWALEGFGASYVLQELLTIKSDDLIGRGFQLIHALLYNQSLIVEFSDAFRVLSCELQSLCLDIFLF
jgi:DNA-directed RNA polymerase subunit beta